MRAFGVGVAACTLYFVGFLYATSHFAGGSILSQFVGMVALYVAPVVLCGWVQFRVERTQRAASLGIWPQVIGSAIVAPLVAGFFAAGLWFGLLGGEM